MTRRLVLKINIVDGTAMGGGAAVAVAVAEGNEVAGGERA